MNEQVKPKVKLTGANGNVYNLIGLCQQAAKKAGWTAERIKQFRDRVYNSGSYDHALVVMMEEFDVE